MMRSFATLLVTAAILGLPACGGGGGTGSGAGTDHALQGPAGPSPAVPPPVTAPPSKGSEKSATEDPSAPPEREGLIAAGGRPDPPFPRPPLTPPTGHAEPGENAPGGLHHGRWSPAPAPWFPGEPSPAADPLAQDGGPAGGQEPVPEPATLALFLMASTVVLGLLWRRGIVGRSGAHAST